MGIISEFKAFLDEYKIMGLAIAFIIGAALTALVTSLVSDIIMPLINPILSATGSDWKSASLNMGSEVSVKYGSFWAACQLPHHRVRRVPDGEVHHEREESRKIITGQRKLLSIWRLSNRQNSK
jgi:large conductance mechanosensitive channel